MRRVARELQSVDGVDGVDESREPPRSRSVVLHFSKGLP
jgi:hypothetical protein